MASKLDINAITSLLDSGLGIPTISPVMQKVIDSSESEENTATLINLACHDPAFAVKLLLTDRGSTSLSDISRSLGVKPLRSLLLSTDFVTENEANGKLYQTYRWLWEQTLFVSLSVEVLSEKTEIESSSSLKLMSKLQHLGAFFMLMNCTEHYLPVIELWQSGGGSLRQLEIDTLGFEHITVTQYMFKYWNIVPEDNLLNKYAQDDVIDFSEDKDLALLHLSNQIAIAFFGNYNKVWLDKVYQFGEDYLGLSLGALTDVMMEVGEKENQFVSDLAIKTSSASSLEMLKSINSELSKVTLSYDQMVRELKIAVSKAEALTEQLEAANKELKKSANIDPLTQVYNRRYFEEFLNWNFTRAQRYNTGLGLLMIDIDHFKIFNDTYGHLTGDAVLQEVAHRLSETLRSTDILARFGGEEFVVLLPESDSEAVKLTAGRLLSAINSKSIKAAGNDVSVTVSIGYHAFEGKKSSEIESSNALLEEADLNMYSAKKNGRNQIYPPDMGNDLTDNKD